MAEEDVFKDFAAADVFSIALIQSLTGSMMKWYRRSFCNDRCEK